MDFNFKISQSNANRLVTSISGEIEALQALFQNIQSQAAEQLNAEKTKTSENVVSIKKPRKKKSQ